MEKVMVAVRYVVAGVGAGLVGFGLATAEDVAGVSNSFEALAGAVAYLGAFGVAIYNKIKAR